MARLVGPTVLALAGAMVGAPAASVAVASPARAGGAPNGVSIPPRRASLPAAVKAAKPLGPVSPSQTLHLTVTLKGRAPGKLNAVLAAGERVSPAEYQRLFGPSPSATSAVIRQLRHSGLRVQRVPGSAVLSVAGPAVAVERAFGVRLETYAPRAAPRFYAPLHAPSPVGALRAAISSVVGLDDYQQVTPAGLRAQSSTLPGGYTPTQVLGAYNFKPLMKAGLDGAGQTVVFIEIDEFDPNDLALFAQEFGLPPFQVDVHTSAASGQPSKPEGEADLDLEIVHAIAPKAKLVVFYSNSNFSSIVATYAQIVARYPHAILSASVGGCEQGAQAAAQAVDGSFKRFAATGGTAFVASGDNGAFTCTQSESVQQFDPSGQSPNVSTPADDPYVTAVGGTALFVGRNDTYGRESAWGSPVQQVGSGGGLSPFFGRPGYQQGPGVDNRYSNGMRQVPDVASLGDTNTGWDIATGGRFELIGGTSTGAPLWAGLAALADQALAQHGRRSLGFANPALYFFASHTSSIAAPAFQDVTTGNNLFYPATAGWDFATGLGTPNAAALVDDLLNYEPSA